MDLNNNNKKKKDEQGDSVFRGTEFGKTLYMFLFIFERPFARYGQHRGDLLGNRDAVEYLIISLVEQKKKEGGRDKDGVVDGLSLKQCKRNKQKKCRKL